MSVCLRFSTTALHRFTDVVAIRESNLKRNYVVLYSKNKGIKTNNRTYEKNTSRDTPNKYLILL